MQRLLSYRTIGKTFNTYHEACRSKYVISKLKCECCGAKLEKSSHHYWIRELAKNPEKELICKPCKDSRNMQKYNNSPKHHKDLLKHQYDMSYLTKSLKTYFDKINYQYNDLIELETKLIHFAKSNPNYIKVKNVDIKYKVYNSWLNFMRECISRTYLNRNLLMFILQNLKKI